MGGMIGGASDATAYDGGRAGQLVYWLAVVAVSIALVIGLILWFEAQDESASTARAAHPG